MGFSQHHMKMYFDLKKQFEEYHRKDSENDEFFKIVRKKETQNKDQLSPTVLSQRLVMVETDYKFSKSEIFEGHIQSVLGIIETNLNHRNFDDWNKNVTPS